MSITHDEAFPLETCSAAVLPLLLQAQRELHYLGAPRAAQLARDIDAALVRLIEVAADVECYGNKWSAGRMGDLAADLAEATRDWWEG